MAKKLPIRVNFLLLIASYTKYICKSLLRLKKNNVEDPSLLLLLLA